MYCILALTNALFGCIDKIPRSLFNKPVLIYCVSILWYHTCNLNNFVLSFVYVFMSFILEKSKIVLHVFTRLNIINMFTSYISKYQSKIILPLICNPTDIITKINIINIVFFFFSRNQNLQRRKLVQRYMDTGKFLIKMLLQDAYLTGGL